MSASGRATTTAPAGRTPANGRTASSTKTSATPPGIPSSSSRRATRRPCSFSKPAESPRMVGRGDAELRPRTIFQSTRRDSPKASTARCARSRSSSQTALSFALRRPNTATIGATTSSDFPTASGKGSNQKSSPSRSSNPPSSPTRTAPSRRSTARSTTPSSRTFRRTAATHGAPSRNPASPTTTRASKP